MSPTTRRVAAWLVLLVGLSVVLPVLKGILPRENRLRIDLPPERAIERVKVEVSNITGEILTGVELRAPDPNPRSLECVMRLPPGDYRVSVCMEDRPARQLDKNHGGGWTRVGVLHQIRFEGEDHHFPPPDNEAK